jgi:hypothetical protein
MSDKMHNPDSKKFPDAGNKNCPHTIGLYKSGRCRACGYKYSASLRKRAKALGLEFLLKLGYG